MKKLAEKEVVARIDMNSAGYFTVRLDDDSIVTLEINESDFDFTDQDARLEIIDAARNALAGKIPAVKRPSVSVAELLAPPTPAEKLYTQADLDEAVATAILEVRARVLDVFS